MDANNYLKEKLHNCFVNGINENGIEITDGTDPTYGGTDSGEAFDGFTVYIINRDEMDDPRNKHVPALLVVIDTSEGALITFDNETESINIEVHVIVPYTLVLTVEDTVLEKSSTCDYYVDHVKKFLRKLVFHELTVSGEGRVSQFKTSDASDGNKKFWLGGAGMAFEYLPGGIYGDGVM